MRHKQTELERDLFENREFLYYLLGQGTPVRQWFKQERPFELAWHGTPIQAANPKGTMQHLRFEQKRLWHEAWWDVRAFAESQEFTKQLAEDLRKKRKSADELTWESEALGLYEKEKNDGR